MGFPPSWSSTKAPATEMALIAEITTGGPCGLRQWLCDIDPPFGCHTTMTTTSFTQTSTIHLEKESLKASFQNPSLKCLGDREYINWASSNQECAEATLLRHAANSQVCAYHFADSGCYVWPGIKVKGCQWTTSFFQFLLSMPVGLVWIRVMTHCCCFLRFNCREEYGQNFEPW